MNPTEIALVRAGFESIAPKAETVGMMFYAMLFEMDPSLRRLFPRDLRPQAGHLMAALAMVVRSLDNLAPVIGRVQELGRRHAAYGVAPRDFATGGAAFLATLEAGLGDAFTDDARLAWSAAYQTLADAMIGAMSETATVVA